MAPIANEQEGLKKKKNGISVVSALKGCCQLDFIMDITGILLGPIGHCAWRDTNCILDG